MILYEATLKLPSTSATYNGKKGKYLDITFMRKTYTIELVGDRYAFYGPDLHSYSTPDMQEAAGLLVSRIASRLDDQNKIRNLILRWFGLSSGSSFRG